MTIFLIKTNNTNFLFRLYDYHKIKIKQFTYFQKNFNDIEKLKEINTIP